MKKSEETKKLGAIVMALEEKKGLNLVVLSVDHLSGYTDHLIFVTGTSVQHNKTLAEHTLRSLKDGGWGKYSAEGEQNARWILIDAGSVIVQIMLDEIRDYYDIESLWRDAPRLSPQDILMPS